jgi:hypothetical protein
MMPAPVLADPPNVIGTPLVELSLTGPRYVWPPNVGPPQPTFAELHAVADPPTEPPPEPASAEPRPDVPLAAPPDEPLDVLPVVLPVVLLAEPSAEPHHELIAAPPAGPLPDGPPIVAEQ